MAKKNDDPFNSEIDTFNIDTQDINVNDVTVDVSQARVKQGPPPTSQQASPPPPSSDQSAAAVGTDDGSNQLEIPRELGILALRNAVVFPGTVLPLAVGRPRSQRLLETALSSSKIIGVITQKDPAVDDPGPSQMYAVGAVVNILKMIKMPDGQNSMVVHGLVRFRILQWLGKDPYLRARIEVVNPPAPEPSRDLEALINSIHQMAQQMIELTPNIPEEVNVILNNIEDPAALADFLAANINIEVAKKQHLLETFDVTQRLQNLSVALASQIELLELSDRIQNRVSKSIDKTQREYYLQEQLKAIQAELGQADQRTTELEELKEMIEKARMPEKIEAEALRELDRLGKIPIMSPEFATQRSYIEWLCELPWSISTQDKLNLTKAKRVLNQDHYNLVKVKKRIIEYLAVRKLNPTGRSPILCFTGPPGVGKTSLGKSIARSMGRKFVRVSLGGMRDEAEIRGHRRTYIGALPGRILQELRKCGSNNPVFMLDEIDKLGQDFRGDPASALLEVLDPEQNDTFTDHYIDQPFDLSRIMFIATANYMGNVPPPLRDRMEVLELPGYTADEKQAIAKKYLVPRQLEENGLTAEVLTFKDEAIEKIVTSYTREAGVRELDRKIAAVCRGIAAEVAADQRKSAVITPTTLNKLLGPAEYESELALRTSVPGVATGLAYTTVGGEILFVESTMVPGNGKLILTGQLGDVMKESAHAALSVLKSKADGTKSASGKGLLARLRRQLNGDRKMSEHDIHVHVPAGAVPKDGPSAGLAIYTSMISLLTDTPVRADVAMTGEITLRGLALPIGGVKEKVLAAKRAGIKTVILPERNRKDLADLPRNAQRDMKFEFVRNVDKVLRVALEN